MSNTAPVNNPPQRTSFDAEDTVKNLFTLPVELVYKVFDYIIEDSIGGGKRGFSDLGWISTISNIQDGTFFHDYLPLSRPAKKVACFALSEFPHSEKRKNATILEHHDTLKVVFNSFFHINLQNRTWKTYLSNLSDEQKMQIDEINFSLYTSLSEEDIISICKYLPNLSHVILRSLSYSGNTLARIINACPNAKIIDLRNYKFRNVDDLSGLNQNLNATSLNLSGSNISAKQLPLLINSFPKLQRINLRKCVLLESADVSQILPNKNIKEVDLSEAEIDGSQFITFWNAFLAMRKLSLVKSSKFYLADFSKLNMNNSLQQIDCSHTNIPKLPFLHIIRASAPNVMLFSHCEKLRVGDLEQMIKRGKISIETSLNPPREEMIIRGGLSPFESRLIDQYEERKIISTFPIDGRKGVKKLDISRSTMSSVEIEITLNSIPEAKTFLLKGCDLSKIDPDKLKINHNTCTLDCSGTRISLPSVVGMLATYPNISSLRLQSCRTLRKGDFSTLPRFPKIKYLSLMRTNLSSHQTIVFLNACSQATDIICSKLSHGDLRKLETNTHLKRFHYPRADLSVENILRLLEVFPNAEKITTYVEKPFTPIEEVTLNNHPKRKCLETELLYTPPPTPVEPLEEVLEGFHQPTTDEDFDEDEDEIE